jgi:molybdopterin molybdotransferase
VELAINGEIPAGTPPNLEVSTGTCVRIFTGSSMPKGADTVVMVEHCNDSGNGKVTIKKSAAFGKNVFKAGENVKKDQIILSSGSKIEPVQIGMLAAVGCYKIPVFKKPMVGVLCTGRELQQTGNEVKSYQIRNSNGPMLKACLKKVGSVECVNIGTATDEKEEIIQSLNRGLDLCDIIITCGGISAGKYDLVPEAIRSLGFKFVFQKVAIKPGKPTLMAVADSGKVIFGLPGNPLSTLVGFYEFVLPAIHVMTGLSGSLPHSHKYPLAEPVQVKGERTRFLFAKLESSSPFNTHQVKPVSAISSADLLGANGCEGVALLPPRKEPYQAGELVEWHSWKGIQV